MDVKFLKFDPAFQKSLFRTHPKSVYEAFSLYVRVSQLQMNTMDTSIRIRCYRLVDLLYARYQRRLIKGSLFYGGVL